MNSYLKIILLHLLIFLTAGNLSAQLLENADSISVSEPVNVISGEAIPNINYSHPQEYTISEITTSGKNNYEDYVLIGYSGLKKGEKITIPGDEISNVVKRFWKQGLFKDVRDYDVNQENSFQSSADLCMARQMYTVINLL